MALTTIDDRGLKTPIDLLDNEKIRFGTGNDLELYHDGSNSRIANTTGQLSIAGGVVAITNAAVSENLAKFTADGAAELYYNGSKTFETISGGAKITGHFVPSGTCNLGAGDNRFNDLYIGNDVVISDNGKIQLGAGPDLEIYSDGTNSFIKCPDTGNNLTLESDQHLYIKVGDSEDAVKCVNGAQVELYHNNLKKLETASYGAITTGTHKVQGAEGGNAELWLQADEGDDDADNWLIYHNASDNKLKFASKPTGSYVDKLILDSSGRIITGAVSTAGDAGYYDDITINNSNSASGEAGGTGITLLSGNSSWGAILFGDVDDNDAGAVKYSHQNNKLVFNTAGNTRAALDSDGLKFNGDTAAANALDDYEQGVFDVTFTSGTAWTSYNKLSYIKIGSQVNVHGQFRIATVASSGTLEISNLPFTVTSQSEGEFYSPPAIYISDIDLNSDTKWVSGYVVPGSTTLKIRGMADNTTTQEIRGTADGYIMINVTYRAA